MAYFSDKTKDKLLGSLLSRRIIDNILYVNGYALCRRLASGDSPCRQVLPRRYSFVLCCAVLQRRLHRQAFSIFFQRQQLSYRGAQDQGGHGTEVAGRRSSGAKHRGKKRRKAERPRQSSGCWHSDCWSLATFSGSYGGAWDASYPRGKDDVCAIEDRSDDGRVRVTLQLPSIPSPPPDCNRRADLTQPPPTFTHQGAFAEILTSSNTSQRQDSGTLKSHHVKQEKHWPT
ncbi:hypothetical protein C0Q70_03742 [Pomacea canaliculata]|uniref:Uncharacterized protein n=1 Tax=Pomacea canaliculata TaxID=400727 RepID=A0A2T7PTK5_POMCA|nr:hypothetical protein C0Q70_03742 [Pomacea canaliculata]